MDNILGSAWRIARIRRAFVSFVLTLKRRARGCTITPALAITEPLPAPPGAVPESTGAPSIPSASQRCDHLVDLLNTPNQFSYCH